MLGGQEDPCVGPDTLRIIEQEEGRPCPRVELDEENAVAASLLSLASDQSALAGLWFETESEALGLSAFERSDIVRRVTQTLARGDVTALLREPRKPEPG